MKKLYYLLVRKNEEGQNVYHQWLRSGLIGKGRGFSECRDPDFAFRTESSMEILAHYEFLRVQLQTPYKWELVGYVMDSDQKSWADVSQVREYKNELPEGESIERFRRRVYANPGWNQEYDKYAKDLNKNYN